MPTDISTEMTPAAMRDLWISDLESQRQETLQRLARIEKALARLGQPTAPPRRFRSCAPEKKC